MPNDKGTTVMARVKRFEEIPDSQKCCEKAREFCQTHAGKEIAQVFPKDVYRGDAICKFCGRRSGNQLIMRALPPHNYIHVESFDLDEGI